MKTERIILSLIAIVIGILVAGGGFFLYQYSQLKETPIKKPVTSLKSNTPTPQSSVLLSITAPKDEEVVKTNQITVSGKTEPDAIIIISTQDAEVVVTPESNGSFSTKLTLDTDENLIEIIAISANGEQKKETRTVTYSTESF